MTSPVMESRQSPESKRGQCEIQTPGRWRQNILYRNLPNIVSFAGVLPLCLLLFDDGYAWISVLIVFNNFMDDLDGILAKKLGLQSEFGAGLDNVCDAVSHILIAMVVGVHHGGIVLAFSLLVSIAILIRVVQRISPSSSAGNGTPTNELMRHLLFVVIMQALIGFDATPYLILIFLLNALSMLVPFAMPHLVRAKTKSVMAIGAVNVALVLVWSLPVTAPFIALVFFAPYLYSLVVGSFGYYHRSAVN